MWTKIDKMWTRVQNVDENFEIQFFLNIIMNAFSKESNALQLQIQALEAAAQSLKEQQKKFNLVGELEFGTRAEVIEYIEENFGRLQNKRLAQNIKGKESPANWRGGSSAMMICTAINCEFRICARIVVAAQNKFKIIKESCIFSHSTDCTSVFKEKKKRLQQNSTMKVVAQFTGESRKSRENKVSIL